MAISLKTRNYCEKWIVHHWNLQNYSVRLCIGMSVKRVFTRNLGNSMVFFDTSLMRQSGFRYFVYKEAENKQHFAADVGGSWKYSEKHKHTTITNDSRIFSASNGKGGRKGNIETSKVCRFWLNTRCERRLWGGLCLMYFFSEIFILSFYTSLVQRTTVCWVLSPQFMNMILWYIFMTSVWYVIYYYIIVCYDLLTCCCLILPIILWKKNY